MKSLRLLLTAFAAALVLLPAAAPAQAHGGGYGGGHGGWYGGGHHGGYGGVHLSFGFPFPYYWGPRYYYGPSAYYAPGYYYGPPVVVTQPSAPPAVYVERDEPAPAAPAPAAPKATWWYWCESARNYYPYVKECPSGWQRVAPQQ